MAKPKTPKPKKVTEAEVNQLVRQVWNDPTKTRAGAGDFDEVMTLARRQSRKVTKSRKASAPSDTMSDEEFAAYVNDIEVKSMGRKQAKAYQAYRKRGATSTGGYWGTGQSFLGGLTTTIVWRFIIAGVIFLVLVLAGQR
jgi:hypothetical protein